MHFVDKMRSSPAGDEEDGRKAPGPKKADDTIVVSTRVEAAVAEALGAIAKADGHRISVALREAVLIYTGLDADERDRRRRADGLALLIGLRSDLARLGNLYAAAARNGSTAREADLVALRQTIRSINDAAGRMTS